VTPTNTVTPTLTRTPTPSPCYFTKTFTVDTTYGTNNFYWSLIQTGIPGTTTGSVWYQRNFNFTSITAINNNPNVAVRIVSAFDPTSGTYLASASTSTYGGGGTCRYDLIKISAPLITNL
jgi:hypothetical protein